MRFAILGTRGIPARYGGFETFAEEISTRLTARGHQVTVYCREHYTDPSGHPSSGHPSSSQVDATYHIDPTYRGVRLKYLPTIRHKYLDITPEEWNRVLTVNLTGVFQVAQEVARHMVQRGGPGVILQMASTNAYLGHKFYADYNATKAGVVQLTRTMALELAPHVRVNAVAPGYVMTPMQRAEYTDEMFEELNQKIPLRRHAQPEEVAGLFAYLASDDAAYITGQVYSIDGGESAGGLASR